MIYNSIALFWRQYKKIYCLKIGSYNILHIFYREGDILLDLYVRNMFFI